MIATARTVRHAARGGRPLCEWDPARDAAPATLRLFGRLGEDDLERVLDAIIARARGPRDLVLVDFSGVEHVDFRAVAGFLASLARWRDRGAGVWLVGVSPYVRQLMDVSGQGSLRRSLSWDVGPAGERARFEGDDLRSAERRALRAGVWN